MLALPNAAVGGAARGLAYSFEVLVPSLFPFMFLSNFAAEYGISRVLGKPLRHMTEKLFNLPGESGVTILLSLIGGFPVGAGGINVLRKQGYITNEQAQRMLMFCVNSGPAFLISVVGAQLYGNLTAGIILLAAQVSASLSIGIVTGIISRHRENKNPLSIDKSSLEICGLTKNKAAKHTDNTHEKEKSDFSSSFVQSCKSACTSVINMCALVVLFSAFIDTGCAAFSVSEGTAAYCVVTSLFEVTSGCAECAACRVPLYITAAVVGWGGISVHFQVFSAAERVNINKTLFFAARGANAVLSGLYTFAGTLLLGGSTQVFSTAKETTAGFPYGTIQGSVALLVASVLFLIFIHSYIFADNCSSKIKHKNTDK